MGASLISVALGDDVHVLDRDVILQRPFWSVLGRKPDPRWYAIHHFDNMTGANHG
jgi:hypothetical protein